MLSCDRPRWILAGWLAGWLVAYFAGDFFLVNTRELLVGFRSDPPFSFFFFCC